MSWLSLELKWQPFLYDKNLMYGYGRETRAVQPGLGGL